MAMDATALDKLVGMTLMAAMADEDSAEMRFTACSLSVYARFESSQSVLALVGKPVVSVELVPDARLLIAFAGGDSFTAALVPGAWKGAEPFVAEFDGAKPAEDW